MTEILGQIEPMQPRGADSLNKFIDFAVMLIPSGWSAWFVCRNLTPDQALAFSRRLSPQRVTPIVDRLPTDYLLDMVPLLDPFTSKELLEHISPEAVARISKSLVDQREFSAISRLAGFLSPAAMVQAMQAFHAASDLLNVAIEVEDKRQLSPAIVALSAQKLASLLVAADKGGKWQDIFDIVDAMDESTQNQLGERLAELQSKELTGLLEASLVHHAWPQLLLICEGLSEDVQATLASKIAQQDEGLHLRFMQAANAAGRMQKLLKLVGFMPMADQRRLVRMAGRHGIRITSAL